MPTPNLADTPRLCPSRSKLALLALSATLTAGCLIDTRVEGGTGSDPAPSSAEGGGAPTAGAGAGGQAGVTAGAGGQAGGPGGGSPGGSANGGGSGSGGSGGTAAPGGSGGLGGAGGSAGSASKAQRLGGALKIMPFGDSITASTCYRARLAELLEVDHAGDYDFVGSQTGDKGCGFSYDTGHEGHGGYLITQHTGELASWAAANPTDVVLLHFATNDVWNNVPTDSILAAYGQAVDEFRKHNASVTILVAQLIPLEPDGCGHCDVSGINAAIPEWAATKATAESQIIVVDQFTGYSAAADSDDKVHPNDSGSGKMAQRWAAALAPLF